MPNLRLVTSAFGRATRTQAALTAGARVPRNRVLAVAVNAQRQALAFCPETVTLWNVESAAVLQTRGSPVGRLTTIALVPGQPLAVSKSLGDKNTVRVWHVETGLLVRSLHAETHACALAVSAQGRRVLAGSDDWGDEYLVLWDLDSGAVLHAPDTKPVARVSLSPDGRWGIAQYLDSTAVLWDWQRGAPARVLSGDHAHVWHIVERDRRLLVVSSAPGGDLVVWDLASGAEVTRLTGHRSPVQAVAVSPDATLLVAAADRSVRAWNSADGCALGVLSIALDVTAGAVAPDGRMIIVGDAAGGVHVVRLEP